MATEKRRSQRIEVNDTGSILWQTESGASMAEKIVVTNLADYGVMIETARNLPVRQRVQIKVPAREIDGSASVRHCRQKGLKYRIGLELSYSISAKPKVQRWT
jgi:hypothetical protein